MDRLLGWLTIVGRRGWQLGGAAVGFLVLWTAFRRLLLLVTTVFVALILAVLLAPVARRMERTGVPRTLGVLVAVLGGALLVLGLAALVWLQVAGQMGELTSQFDQVRSRVTLWLTEGPLSLSQAQIDGAVETALGSLRSHWTVIVNQTVAAITAIGALVTALVLAFFFLRDADRINEWILTRLVSDEQREAVSASGRRARDALHGYIRGTLIIGALDGVFIGLALLLLDVPLAVPLGVLTFLGGFFPIVGATAAGMVATLVAIVSNGVTAGLVVLAVVILVQQVDGNVLQPLIMGRAVHLHPVVVLGALTAGGLLAGIVGAFLAVPTAAVLAAVGAEARERRSEQAPLAERADGRT